VLGSRYRGDDAVGPLVGDRLRARGIPVVDCRDEPTRLIDALAGLELAVVVDAVRSGAPVGTVHLVDGQGSVPCDPGLASSHALALGDALALGEALGRAPGRVVIVGVEGRRFGMGDTPSREVESALDGVVETIERLLGTR
jgi:hydrogenase maturation protease